MQPIVENMAHQHAQHSQYAQQLKIGLTFPHYTHIRYKFPINKLQFSIYLCKSTAILFKMEVFRSNIFGVLHAYSYFWSEKIRKGCTT
jgi:hypothetical protein